MMNNMLRAPLIKSAAMLVIVSVLIYLTATSAEGSFWGSLGTLFLAVFRIIQLSIGLILSLVFCLAVLTAIFFGCVAMVSRESAAAMAETLRQIISDRLFFLKSLVVTNRVPAETVSAQATGDELEQHMQAALENSLDMIREDQTIADKNIEWLMERVDHLEQGGNTLSLADRLDRQAVHLDEVAGKVTDLQEQLRDLQAAVNELMQRPADYTGDSALRELGGRLDGVEQNIVSLREDLTGLQEGIMTEALPVKKEMAPEKMPDEIRLFAHIPNKAMQEKIAELVSETLDGEMSYAQAIDHLVRHTSGKTKETITAHPSLTREYIRYRREKG